MYFIHCNKGGGYHAEKIKLYDDQKLIYIVYAVFILAASVALTSWATIYQDHIINMILF